MVLPEEVQLPRSINKCQRPITVISKCIVKEHIDTLLHFCYVRASTLSIAPLQKEILKNPRRAQDEARAIKFSFCIRSEGIGQIRPNPRLQKVWIWGANLWSNNHNCLGDGMQTSASNKTAFCLPSEAISIATERAEYPLSCSYLKSRKRLLQQNLWVAKSSKKPWFCILWPWFSQQVAGCFWCDIYRCIGPSLLSGILLFH